MGCTGSSAQNPYKGTLTELRSLQDTIEALSERISVTLRRSEKLIDSIRDSVNSYEQLGATKFAALERCRGDVPHTNINRQRAVSVQNSMEIVTTDEAPRFRAINTKLLQQLKKLDSDRRAIEARFKSLSQLIESRQSAEMSLRSAQEKGTTTDKEREKLDELNRKVAHLQAESKDSEKRRMGELETFQAEVDQVATSAQEYVDSVQRFLDSICTSLNAKPAPPQNHFSSLHPSEASPVGKEASFRNSSSCPGADPVSDIPQFNSCTADLPPSQDNQQAPATKISVGRTQTSEAARVDGFDSAARVSPTPQEPLHDPVDGEDIYNMQPPTQQATM